MNKIINADCLIEMKQMKTNSIDLIFADPPYWMRVEGKLIRPSGSRFDGCQDDWDQFSNLDDYEQFTINWLKECQRILKPTGSIWVIGGMQCIYMIGNVMQKLGFWFLNDVIWQKTNPTPNFAGTRFNNSHETLIWAAKNKKAKPIFNYKTAKELNKENITIDEFNKGRRKQMGSIWKFAVCNGNERLKENGKKVHSTQKPEQLLYRIITTTSRPNDIVFDPFGGTMTTAAVAKKTGRKWISIEKDKKYYNLGKKRVLKVRKKMGAIENLYFDEKPPKVNLIDMYNNKYISLRSNWKFKDSDYKFKPKIINNKLMLEVNNKVIDIHTAAGVIAKSKNRLNGFEYWKILYNKEWILLKELRNIYREEELGWKPEIKNFTHY